MSRSEQAVLEATADMLDDLSTLVRTTGLSGPDAPKTQAAARALFQAIDDARPPFALRFVGSAL